MSEMEHHIGKLKKVEPLENETTIQLMNRILFEHGKIEMPSYCSDIKDWFSDEFREKYFLHNDIVYKVSDKEFEDDSDIIQAELESDGTIKYQLRYYNGGACFDECLEEALNKLLEK